MWLCLMGLVHVFEPGCRGWGGSIGQGINLDSVNWDVKKQRQKKRKKKSFKANQITVPISPYSNHPKI